MRTFLIVFATLASLTGVARAQAPKPSTPAPTSTPGTEKPAPPKGTPPSAITEPAYLKITLDTSRSPIAMDTEAGLSAEIKNVSSVPVTLFEKETVFITMPEMRIYGDSPNATLGCATFPTQGNVAAPKRSPDLGHDLLLQPGDSYRVFWDMTTNGCTGERQNKRRFWSEPLRWAEEKWQRIAFKPGTYKFYMDVVVHPQDQTPYHSVTEGRDAQVSASQQMVLLGAFLGGLLAYIIKLYYGVGSQLTVKMDDSLFKRIIGYTEWLSAGLFGAAMAILASRLSDTFPVKVSADDFWGAMTLGFVFQWLGVRLLEKLPGMGPSTPPAPAAAAPPPGPPTPAPGP
jgi:hypothetical protein